MVQKQVVFIMGTGHCGSTLLELILGSHPQIMALGEVSQLKLHFRTPSTEDICRICQEPCPYWSERINPAISSMEVKNWGQCAVRTGGTPGKKNSLFAPVQPTEKKLTANPNPFSPDGDGHEDITIISYDLPMTTSQVNLKIYDIHGRLVRFLCNNEPSGSHRDLPWDGMDNDGRKCRMGIYILYLEAISATEGILERLKETVVIGGNL